MKNFFQNIIGRGKKSTKEPTMQDQLNGLVRDRHALARELENLEEKKKAIISAGVGLTGPQAQINRDNYQAACDESKVKMMQFNMLGQQIKQTRKQIEMQSLTLPKTIMLDIEELERKQIELEIQQEEMKDYNRRLAEISARQEKIFDSWNEVRNETDAEYNRLVAGETLSGAGEKDDEYSRLVAEAAEKAEEEQKINFEIPETSIRLDMGKLLNLDTDKEEKESTEGA